VNSEGGAEPSEESVKAIARFKSLLRGHADIEKATGGTTKAAAGAQANAAYSVPGSATMMKAASGAASAAATAAKAVAAAASVARKAMQGMFEGGFTKSAPAPTFADIETCVGCQYVWEKVRMNLGKSDNLDAIMQTFEATCQDMPDIFYEPCTTWSIKKCGSPPSTQKEPTRGKCAMDQASAVQKEQPHWIATSKRRSQA